MKTFIAALLLLISSVYLLNFSMGILELPDYLPIIGNLDEAAATLVFISAMKHFGYDLTEWLPFRSLGTRKRQSTEQ